MPQGGSNPEPPYFFNRVLMVFLAVWVDGEETIIVIVRQFPRGKKHFLSVYNKKNKKPPL